MKRKQILKCYNAIKKSRDKNWAAPITEWSCCDLQKGWDKRILGCPQGIAYLYNGLHMFRYFAMWFSKNNKEHAQEKWDSYQHFRSLALAGPKGKLP